MNNIDHNILWVDHSEFRQLDNTVVQNLFRVGRHLFQAIHYRLLRTRSLSIWDEVTVARFELPEPRLAGSAGRPDQAPVGNEPAVVGELLKAIVVRHEPASVDHPAALD